MKILIAEDDLSSRRILEKILTQWGYEVISVSNGTDAVDRLLDANAPKLALIDWIMPDKDGIEVCRILRLKEITMPPYIILLTGKGDKKDIEKGLDSGADDYIVKPYDKNELRARINVGRRMVELQDAVAEKDKFQGGLEMAGAICHEINQPLMCISGYSEILLMDVSEDNPQYEVLRKINEQAQRLGQITRKLMNITEYKTKIYLKRNIIDIDEVSPKDGIHYETTERKKNGSA